MSKTVPSDIISQLEKLANGELRKVSGIEFPHRLMAGSPEYNAARFAVAKLRQRGEPEIALELARLFAAATPEDRKVMLQLARILWVNNKYSEAANLLDEMGLVGTDHEWLSVRAATFNSIGDYESALKMTVKFRQAAPMVMTQAERRDLPVLAILNTGPNILIKPEIAVQKHFSGNFITQYAKKNPNKFRFASFWLNAGNLVSTLRKSPIPDVVVNNAVSGELADDPDIAPNIQKCLRRWNRKCINAPDDVRVTARDKLAAKLSGSQRIVAPKTLYFKSSDDNNAMADRIESEFTYPLILRAPFFQNGADMFLVEDRNKALELIPTLQPGFFAIEFIKNLHENDMYRKMRGAFIEDEFFMLRVDYGPDWMIHGHRDQAHRIEFYNENPQYLEEEIAICKDPAREFGKPVMRALHELRSIIKLDYFGVDFDISGDGKLIVYEANAAMNFLSKRGLVHPHPEEAGAAMTECFTSFLMSRIERPKMALTR